MGLKSWFVVSFRVIDHFWVPSQKLTQFWDQVDVYIRAYANNQMEITQYIHYHPYFYLIIFEFEIEE